MLIILQIFFGNTRGFENWRISLGYSLVLSVGYSVMRRIWTNHARAKISDGLEEKILMDLTMRRGLSQRNLTFSRKHAESTFPPLKT